MIPKRSLKKNLIGAARRKAHRFFPAFFFAFASCLQHRSHLVLIRASLGPWDAPALRLARKARRLTYKQAGGTGVEGVSRLIFALSRPYP